MFENLDVFRIANAMARHAGHRQAVVAQNVAHADTPGYVTRDLPDFKSVYLPANDTGALRATRDKHMHGSMGGEQRLPDMVEVEAQASPNGNQVSLETEILKSVEAKRQQDRAIAIYKSSLTILRNVTRTS